MKRIEELANLVVDGEATAGERAELDTLVRTSPEARALFEKTQELALRLESMRPAEPPGELRASILRQLVPRRRARSEHRRLVFGLAWAAAAAFVFVMLILQPVSFNRRQSATMAPVVARFPSLIVRHEGDLYRLEPIADAPARVSVQFDPARLSFVGISGGENPSFSESQVSFTLRNLGERATVYVRRRGEAASSEVRVFIDQREVGRAVVPLE